MKAAFFFDSARLGRQWSLNVSEQALSGTDGILLRVYTKLAGVHKGVHLLSTSKPVSQKEKTAIVLVKDLIDAYHYCNNNQINFLVFNAEEDLVQYRLFQIAQHNHTKIIAWAHCSPSFDWMTKAYHCPAFYKLISVSNVQRYNMAHHPLFNRTVTILNFVDAIGLGYLVNPTKHKETFITYIGALKASKGFHHLADVWPEVHRRFPSYILNVCGSPGLYGKTQQLGPHGIAEEEYERRILAPLGGSRESAKELNVAFQGSVPKTVLYDIISRSTVVVVNPNATAHGSTETFCVSAAEAMSLRVPVIGGKAEGLLEVVGNKRGGLLAANEEELLSAITYILEHKEKAIQFGKTGRKRMITYFNEEKSIRRWAALLNGENIDPNDFTEFDPRNGVYYFKRAIGILFPLHVINRIKKVKKWSRQLAIHR
ncbi:glycosyltransferase family 4 protein [Parapedobacter sp. ISTM3]|uniref:glycosyltransferase family 4 protein n=1 Tax=Parapedobacter sp. ISTM3 TaxID=2800130 RepID=UPI001904F609|nr:glycosyltransferase family 4 protein [Parapedobacter sp. ISTM3]MBK1442212.1 glycosyltransferase family 4 protein [Parapedobacter sp. ISTM3]